MDDINTVTPTTKQIIIDKTDEHWNEDTGNKYAPKDTDIPQETAPLLYTDDQLEKWKTNNITRRASLLILLTREFHLNNSIRRRELDQELAGAKGLVIQELQSMIDEYEVAHEKAIEKAQKTLDGAFDAAEVDIDNKYGPELEKFLKNRDKKIEELTQAANKAKGILDSLVKFKQSIIPEIDENKEFEKDALTIDSQYVDKTINNYERATRRLRDHFLKEAATKHVKVNPGDAEAYNTLIQAIKILKALKIRLVEQDTYNQQIAKLNEQTGTKYQESTGFGFARLKTYMTIQMLAQEILGDRSRWVELVVLNKLSSPYIVKDEASRQKLKKAGIDGIIIPGDKIKIPVAFVKSNAIYDVVIDKPNKVTDHMTTAEKELGVDLALSPEGDIDLSSGDARLIGGKDNLIQGLFLKLAYDLGDVLSDETIGAGSLIGEKQVNALEVRDRVANTIERDPRITSINDFYLQQAGAEAHIYVSMSVKGFSESLALTIKV